MSYAVRNDGLGWRAVNGPQDIDPATETFADTQPVVVGPTANQLLRGASQVALDAADITMIRCVENSVSVPASWATYRKALRAILNGSDNTSTTLPIRPAYPDGA